jgi:hypothetical protein
MEQETIFSSGVTYTGIFSFKNFYKFCYEWLTDETGLIMSEGTYKEKLVGDSKEIEIVWTGYRKLTDYFKFDIEIRILIRRLKEIEINQGGAKVKTNQGWMKINTKGILVRDYEGKFEISAFYKFLRSIYEKWVIKPRIEEYEERIAEDCDEFLAQAKSYLDLEGRKRHGTSIRG